MDNENITELRFNSKLYMVQSHYHFYCSYMYLKLIKFNLSYNFHIFCSYKPEHIVEILNNE